MILTDAQLVELKAEIDTDPKNLGYAGLKDEPVAALLNEIGLSVPPEILPNTSVAVKDVLDAVDGSELSAVNINGLQFFLSRLQTASGSIDISQGSPIKGQVAAIFTVGNAPNSRTALDALKTREASRAEILFGSGVTVSYMDVGTARLVI